MMWRAWIAAALAVVLGAAAQAQFTDRPRTPPAPRGDWSHVDSGSPRIATTREQRDIADRIRDGHDGGQLSRKEVRRLRRENGQLDTLAERYGSDGLSDAETRELQTRAPVLRDQVNAQRLDTAPAPKRP